ncbi:MAG TPA: hypothetical protein VFG72_16090 [Marmoricola sp.]|nr:hypothetical protein [Marmoricola sp.]
MTGERPEPGAPDDRASTETEAQRRRRRAEVFGDVLPESTRDDRDPEEGPRDAAVDEWLRRNVPPHHG